MYSSDKKLDSISNFVHFELTALYYHSIETFLRLFLAHCDFKPCPWLELSRDKNYKNFKERIIQLANGNFNFQTKHLSKTEILLSLIYGIKDINNLPESLPNTSITNEFAATKLESWIKWCSQELLSVYDYNAFKHGLALYSTTTTLNLEITPSESIGNSGHSLVFLDREPQYGSYLWKKTTNFIPLAERQAIIFCLMWLMSNVLNAGQQRYLHSNFTDKIFFIGNDPSVFLTQSTLNQFNLSASSITEHLGFEIKVPK